MYRELGVTYWLEQAEAELLPRRLGTHGLDHSGSS
jgi:hypothetical protein